MPARRLDQSQGQRLFLLAELLRNNLPFPVRHPPGPNTGHTGQCWISVVFAATKKGPEGPCFNHLQIGKNL